MGVHWIQDSGSGLIRRIEWPHLSQSMKNLQIAQLPYGSLYQPSRVCTINETLKKPKFALKSR